jgi:hypothetical protein
MSSIETILYVKIHNVTGLKYFGKTTKKDPEKYIGSGKYWKNHVKKHGYSITTVIIGKFSDPKECKEFALNFSKKYNIVESDEWANLINENGMDGAPKGHIGHKFTDEQIKKLSETSLERWTDEEFRKRISQSQKESWTEERKLEQKIRLTGIKRPDHAEKLRGRKLTQEQKAKMKKPKHENFGKLLSATISGVPKSEEHKQKLRVPKIKICRLTDKKEMSVNHYTRWINKLLILE